jgi:hypothetical protein
VVFTWDGAAEDSNRLFSRFRDVAQANNASMTYFLSGVYTPPESRRMLYQPPRHARGASDIPFLKDSQIAVTMQEVRQAWLEGYEIGTHFNGHFCEPNGGASWTVQDWASELRQAKGLVTNWRTDNGLMSTPPLPFNVNQEIVGGRAPCLEGQKNLIPAEKAAGFRYDAIEDTVRSACTKPGVHCVSFRQLADWMDRQGPARLAALRDPANRPARKLGQAAEVGLTPGHPDSVVWRQSAAPGRRARKVQQASAPWMR